MSKRIYISADYSEKDGDRNVIDVLHAWGKDALHKVDYVDTASVVSGSVSDDSDCRVCELKREFNQQINASSVVLFVIGDKTADRTAGSLCRRLIDGPGCDCTPYKQNAGGTKRCIISGPLSTPGPNDDVGKINQYSFIRHEYEQAKKKGKRIVVVYNSLYKQPSWMPSYMEDCVDEARPFWIKNAAGMIVGNYSFIKGALGYE